jgi:acetylornithine deacetylase
MPILPPFRTLLQRLIAEPSVSSVSPEWDQPNVRVVDLLQEWLHELGFRTEKLAIPGCPGKFNLVATLGRGPGGLVLSGHTDTVPCDPSRWSSDPFELTERDDRLYGLGTCDMKGFFAVVLEAIRELDARRLQRPLVVLATADEESTMCGARALLQAQRRLGRHAVIGEPTGLKPVRMHKGIAMEAIRVVGQAGHSSDPSLGRNALEGMVRVLNEILAWREALQARHRNPSFEVEVPTVNLGHIHGGDNPNRICGQCELHIDVRPLPGMDLDELREELQQRLRRVLENSGLTLEMRPLFSGVPAMETPAGAQIVQAAERLTGHPAQAAAYATEGPLLNALGMETVILGPGSIEQAHQPNEFLALEQARAGIRIVRELVTRFCLEP